MKIKIPHGPKYMPGDIARTCSKGGLLVPKGSMHCGYQTIHIEDDIAKIPYGHDVAIKLNTDVLIICSLFTLNLGYAYMILYENQLAYVFDYTLE